MINVFENNSKKVVGKTSLFISFDYNPNVLEIIKNTEGSIYHKDFKFWEVPLNRLSYLIDNLTLLDDINLDFLPDENLSEIIEPTLDYKVRPFDHQLEAIKWMINIKNGLLLDVPGLGKTLDVIYAAEELREKYNIEHCLIICGINTLKQNWKKEIQKFSNLSCVVIGEKVNKKGNITYASVRERAEQLYNKIDEFFVIINVESLRDSTVVEGIRCSKNNFDMVVVDEIHKCLDYNSLVYTNIGKIRIGDLVENKLYYNGLKALSYNTETGNYEYKKIVNGYKNFVEKTIELTFEDDGKIYELECTPDHLIFTNNRGWVQAQYLSEDDDIKII